MFCENNRYKIKIDCTIHIVRSRCLVYNKKRLVFIKRILVKNSQTFSTGFDVTRNGYGCVVRRSEGDPGLGRSRDRRRRSAQHERGGGPRQRKKT